MYTGNTYLWPWKGGVKDGTSIPSTYNVYPIPSSALQANPNLNQNDGPYLMVTHYVVIQAFTGISLPSGGMAVYDLKAQKAYDLKIDN